MFTGLIMTMSVSCASEDAEPADRQPSTSGKGDRVVTVEQCEAFIADYDPQPCGEFDEFRATLQEHQDHLACLEAAGQDDISTDCCGLSELQGSSFCEEALDRGYQFLCEAGRDDFEVCILDPEEFGGTCHWRFQTLYADAPISCCDRIETWACDKPLAGETIPDQQTLQELFRGAHGYFWQTPLFDRMYAVDILPENLQNSLAIHNNPYRDDRIANETPIEQHEIVERIPVQYGVYGYLTDRSPVHANAYVTLWRTASNEVAMIVHAYNPNTVGFDNAYGWHDETWGILEEGPCDVMTDGQLAAPGLPELSFALDFANGHPLRSCLSQHFREVPADHVDVSRPIAELLYRLRFVVGEDSRLSQASSVWSIETSSFSGLLVEAEEVLTSESLELLGDDYEPVHARFLLDHRGDPIRVYDDHACERGATYATRAKCFGDETK